jgi:hypothetical protein
MKKLRTYKTFEARIGEDENVEEKIDLVLTKLLDKKVMISMLANTIDHVCSEVRKTMPNYMDE